MKKHRLVCLLLCALLLTGCGAPAPEVTSLPTAPETSGAVVEVTEAVPQRAEKTEAFLEQLPAATQEDNYRVFYEIFVYSFCDSNGDGIGDLRGVISKLDYLQDLGIGGIWLMPIHPSTSYHKYNVGDYLSVDPDYGTMADFEELADQCRQRNILLILDLVVNHTGSDHPWFTQATDYLRTLDGAEPDLDSCPYVDYYFFSREGGQGYTQVGGADWCYESQFSPDMPDLNLGSDAVREEIRSVMDFWLQKGVAGFRIDAAKEFYSGSVSKNVEVLRWLQETGRSLKEDIFLVAEVWDSFMTIADYYESGIPSIFNFPFGDSTGKIISTIRGAGTPSFVGSYATALEKADRAYGGSNPEYIDAPFLSNHDVGRIAGFCAGDGNKTKLAGAMNLFMSGSAFVYYGEEIGMTGSGNDPSKRAPMYWNETRDQGVTTPPPECTLPEQYPFPSLEGQVNDDGSIYNYYRRAIAIRNALPVLSHGRTTAETVLNTGCVSAFRKTWEEQECIVLMNISDQPGTVDLTGYEDWNTAYVLSPDWQEPALDGAALTLPPWTAVIMQPTK